MLTTPDLRWSGRMKFSLLDWPYSHHVVRNQPKTFHSFRKERLTKRTQEFDGDPVLLPVALKDKAGPVIRMLKRFLFREVALRGSQRVGRL